jgi:hypothetical protein
MERLYGMDLPSKAGKVLCRKCHTYYTEKAGKQKCPWCDTLKPDPNAAETAKGGKPTQVDRDLFAFLKKASVDQISRLTTFLKTDVEIFKYMGNATLAEKQAIMKYIEDEIL